MSVKAEKNKNSRLAKNFHRTFIPERPYVGALLNYVAGVDSVYDLETIAQATGIPTGKSSGKAIPTADYAIGMGLVKVNPEQGGQRTMSLTNFGRKVYLEDRSLGEELTQWLAHLFLCNKVTGAELWYQLFWNAYGVFGAKFPYENAIQWITQIIGAKDGGKSASPILRMYQEVNSFAVCGALVVEEGMAFRKKAPLNGAYSIGYAAWMAELLERSGRMVGQLTVDDLESECGFRSLTCWTMLESQSVLGEMESRGLITLDRHMSPWIVSFKESAAQYWNRLFEEFI